MRKLVMEKDSKWWARRFVDALVKSTSQPARDAVKRLDGQGRVPALEILVVTSAVGNLIRQRKTFQVHSLIQTGAAEGMCLFDDSLRQLVGRKVVSSEEALRYCENPNSFTQSIS